LTSWRVSSHVRLKIMSAIFRPSLINRFFAMSSTDVFSKLSSPLRELVVGSAQQDSQQLGVSEKDQTDIAQWIQKAAQPDIVKSDALPVCHHAMERCLVLLASHSH
jgi:hypothetical protein